MTLQTWDRLWKDHYKKIAALVLATVAGSVAALVGEPWLLVMGMAAFVIMMMGLAIWGDPRWGVWLILLATPLDKFRVYLTQPISFNLKLIHVLLVVTLAAWLGRAVLAGRLRLRRPHRVEGFLVLLFAAFALSIISSIDPQSSLETLLQRLLLLAFPVLLVNTIRTQKDVDRATHLLIVAALLSAGYGFLQLLGFYVGFSTDIPGLDRLPQLDYYRMGLKVSLTGQYPRMNAFFNDPNALGAYLLGALALLTSLLLMGLCQSQRLSLWKVGGLAILSLALLATMSRSALLGAAALLLVIAFHYRRQLWTPRLLLLLAAIVLVAVLALGLSPLGRPFIQRMLSQEIDARASSQSHKLFASGAFEMIRAQPFTGIGLGRFADHYIQFVNPEAETAMSHSLYLSLLSETGPLSLIAFVFLLAYLWWSLGRATRWTAAMPLHAHLVGWRAYLLGLAVSSIFYGYLAYEFVWCYLGIMVATLEVARRMAPTAVAEEKRKRVPC